MSRLRLWLFALDRFELKLRGNAGKARNSFIRSAATRYEENGHVPNHLIEAHRKRLANTLDAHYRQVIPYFAATTLKQIKSRRIEKKDAQSLYDGLVSEWIAREATRKARMIADTDRDDVMTAIESGMADGIGVEEIARNIRKVSQLTPYRAATVARTETHQAATYASQTAAEQAQDQFGVKLLKEWLPTLDDRTRPEHRAMQGQPPIPMDEKFSVGGELMDRPGDPSASAGNQINCRCAIAFSEAT